jgi:hypothetical protein
MFELQAYLPKADMRAAAERQMVTVTNQVGADLSAMHAQEWRQQTLPFVAGLGQRKVSVSLAPPHHLNPHHQHHLRSILGCFAAGLPS